MPSNADALRTAAVTKAATPDADSATIFDLVNRQRGEIGRALASQIDPERFVRIALSELRQTPKLQKCTAASVLGALMQSAQLGLEPGSALGLAYLVPYENHKRGVTECQFILGYRGVVTLARRGGIAVHARAVHENDHFDVRFGTDERIDHRPELREDRGATWAYYAVGRAAEGPATYEVMTRAEVHAHAQRFGNTSASSPWTTDFDPMALKTTVIRLARWLPLAGESRAALATDGGTFHFTDGAVEQIGSPLDTANALEPAGDTEDAE